MSVSLVSASLATPRPTDAKAARARFQELKGRVHQELLNRLNLDRLTKMSRDWTPSPRFAASSAGSSTARASRIPLSLFERETLRRMCSTSSSASDRWSCCSRIPRSPTSWSTRPSQVFIERERSDRRDRHHLPRRQAPDADHRAHRQRRRPPHRRVEPDG